MFGLLFVASITGRRVYITGNAPIAFTAGHRLQLKYADAGNLGDLPAKVGPLDACR